MKSLSVIIPTRNRAALLEGTLNSLVDQILDQSEFEVIVVDNGSTDNTKSVCERFSSKLPLVYVFEAQAGLHEGRHAGLRHAKAAVLVYADDDIVAFPTWLDTIKSTFEKDSSIALMGGKNLPKYELPPPFWITQMWNAGCYDGKVVYDLSILDFGNQEKEIFPGHVFGCNFSVRKQVVIDAGGFHPDGMPFDLIRFRGDGETHVSNYIEKTGLKALYHPLASVYHVVTKERITEEYFCKRRYAQGVSDAFTQLKASDFNKKLAIKPPRPNRLKHWCKVILGVEQTRQLRELKTQINDLRASVDKTDLEKRLDASYRNGFNYLQMEYSTDLEVKEWIHRKNYMR